MSVNVDRVETVKKAKELIGNRLQAAPDFVLFQSVEAQLDYLLSILEGSSSDRSRLREINVGHYAVHEFEESDPDLAKELKKVQYVVYKMTGGIVR
jgi:hypothetical protein